jgi:heat-inducible transcriptional repressor
VVSLSRRERAILSAIVTEFTATGEPVGSRTLSKKYGLDLSPATIRNVLADLEEHGYLCQPHSSAGRVPTEAAFRLFIDALMRLRVLSTDDASKIAGWFGDLPPGADIVRGAGRLLSDLTGAAAVLVRSPSPERTLTAIRFIRARPGELLGVIVFSDGTVENRFVQLEAVPSEVELARLHNMLEEAVGGRTLPAVRDHFARALREGQDELRNLRQMGVSLLDAAIGAADGRPEVIIEGQARLIERPEFDSTERIRELVRTLEEREHLVVLLGRIIETGRVQVFLGGEEPDRVGLAVSLVATRYEEDGRPGGAVGVIGPVAMDYPTVIPVVRATAEAMTAALSRGRS